MSTPTSQPAQGARDQATGKPSSARATLEQLRRWWSLRGGWKDFVRSPYTWAAAILLVLTSHFWWTQPWWELPISIMPNLIGFSLGGYAILLAFGDAKFGKLLVPARKAAPPPGAPTLYMTVSAIFVHFILMQIASLVLAVVAQALDFSLADAMPNALTRSAFFDHVVGASQTALGAFGFFVFLYALCLAGAAALSVFGLSELFEMYLKDEVENEAQNEAEHEHDGPGGA